MLNIIKNNKYLILIYTVAMASFVVNLDTYIVNVSLPAMAIQFNTTTTAISWLALSYNLTVVSLLLTFGKLGDKIGLKELFVLGFIIFSTSSLMCGLSYNLNMLILSRFLQGIGASILYALPQAIIAKYLPQEKRGMAFGILASAAALGITLGAPVSGLLSGFFTWRLIFFINIPIGIFAIVFLIYILPKDMFRFTNKKPFDYLGAFLSFIFALTFTLYINQGNNFGWNSTIIKTIFITCIIFFILFIARITTCKFPLLNPELFKNLNFDYANIAMLFVSILLSGTNFLMPFFLAQTKGLNISQIGFIVMTYSISYMISSILSGKISKKVQPKTLSVSAMIINIINTSFFLLTLNINSIMPSILFLTLCGISFSFFITSNNNYVMSMSNKNNAGMIAGTHRMIGRFGMLIGIVLFEAILVNSPQSSGIKPFFNTFLFSNVFCFIALLASLLTKSKNKN